MIVPEGTVSKVRVEIPMRAYVFSSYQRFVAALFPCELVFTTPAGICVRRHTNTIMCTSLLMQVKHDLSRKLPDARLSTCIGCIASGTVLVHNYGPAIAL